MDTNNNMEKVGILTTSVSRGLAGRKAKLKELWTFMQKPSFRKIEIFGHGI
jgi:hypothetical protein